MQLGVAVSEDTVTVGQRFILVVRLRAPRDANVAFQTENDSATSANLTSTQIVGKPVINAVSDSLGTIHTAAYRLAAWDTELQGFGLRDIVVTLGSDTGYVSLGDRGVYVRSVLPADSSLRVPKPPRAVFQIPALNWFPLIVAALALLAAIIGWRVWVWFRAKRGKPLDPFQAAEREFERIEGLGLIASGQSELHVASMTDTMRRYLFARVSDIEPSHTSSELLSRTGSIGDSARELGDLLWRTDLVKFASITIPPDEAERLGVTARSIVRSVEALFVQREKQASLERAA